MPPKILKATGYAAPTPVTDGRCVYAMFANGDVVAVDFAGQQRLGAEPGHPHQQLRPRRVARTVSQSSDHPVRPALKKDGKSRLLAVDAASGETVWEQPRDVPNSWPSPIVIEHDGLWQVITCADPWVIAYAAEDGRELWRCKFLQGDINV